MRIVHAEGDAAARGRAVGRELGDLVQRSLEHYRARLDRPPARVAELVAPFRRAAETALPDLVVQLDALADAAEVSRAELFAVNAWEEVEDLLGEPGLRVAAERCSSFTAVGDGVTLLGHSEHWVREDAESIALVVEDPDEGPAVVSPTVACFLPAVGVNAHRTAQGIDSLTARSDRVGVPRLLVSRHSLAGSDVEDAARRARLPGRAGGYAHVLASPGGRALTVETTADESAELPGPGTHTNHYLDPGLAGVGTERSPSSAARHERLEALLGERPPRTPEEAQAVLADDGVGAQPGGSSATLFAFVCDVEAGRLRVAAGDPREAPFEEVDLSGVV